MIIVCKDPGNISGSQRYIQNCDHSWQENLFEIFPDGLDPRDWRVTLHGSEVDPEYFDMSASPADEDVLVLSNQPHMLSAIYIGLIALAAAAAVYLLTPSYNLGSTTSSKTSSNNSFTGQTNLPRAYQAWPDIFGRNRIYPDIISPSVVEYVNNVKTLRHYFWVGRGSHTLTDVKYAESDVTDYANSAYTIYGDGAAIPEVIEQFANEAVDGQELLGINEGAPTGVSVTDTVTSGSYPIDTAIVTVVIPYSTDAQDLHDSYTAGGVSINTQFSTESTPASGPSPTTYYFSYNAYGLITGFVINLDPIMLTPISCTINMDITQEPHMSGEELTGSITITGNAETTIGPFELSVACTQIWYDVVFLRGLKGTATFTAEWWAVDGAGAEISGSRQSESFSYSGDKLDQKYFTRKVTPAYGLGRYRFQITRTNNADLDNATNQAKLSALYAVRIKENQVYQMNGFGGTAIVVDSSATENATTSSGMKFNAWDTRKVITCNADGTVNYTLSESRRICDSVVHHMHIDAGVPLSKIDVAGLYAIQQSITPAELGYFDGTFDDADVSLGDRVQAMCNAGRILVNREGSKWVFIRDAAQPYPLATFDRRTMANSEFSLTISPTNSGGKDSVHLQWVDSEESNTKKFILLKWDSVNNVPMFGYGTNPLQIELNGCTNYAQALDRAELEMRKIVYLRNSVSDVSLSDAEYVWRGERVRWVDVADVSAGSGEILGVDAGGYLTSEECVFDGASVYKVCITDEHGYSSAFVTATPRTDGVNGFVASWLPIAVIRNHDDIQLGSRYLLVKEAEVGRHDFVLSSKTPNNDGTFNIELAQYDDRVYLRSLTA